MIQTMGNPINSYNSWGRLREVWLGDVYPATWYDHLDSEVRDCFQHLTQITQQDLHIIQRRLEDFGVVVRRPQYQSIDHYVHGANDMLIKPMITPRDHGVVLGRSVYFKSPGRVDPWQWILSQYTAAGANVHTSVTVHDQIRISGANVVRCGRDVYIDLGSATKKNSRQQLITRYHDVVAEHFQDYRVHLIFNGGHLDACFSTLRPGLLLASTYFTGYNVTFPGWDQIRTLAPEFYNSQYQRPTTQPNCNVKWWLPGAANSRAFNDHVIKHAQDWVGDYTETYFDVNCLVLDERNVMMLGEHEEVFRELERRGITVHSVPFRTRTFWDGGLHCLTLDIRRDSVCEDYFPERGDCALTVVG